jgi:hypothetical protein
MNENTFPQTVSFNIGGKRCCQEKGICVALKCDCMQLETLKSKIVVAENLKRDVRVAGWHIVKVRSFKRTQKNVWGL